MSKTNVGQNQVVTPGLIPVTLVFLYVSSNLFKCDYLNVQLGSKEGLINAWDYYFPGNELI